MVYELVRPLCKTAELLQDVQVAATSGYGRKRHVSEESVTFSKEIETNVEGIISYRYTNCCLLPNRAR